MHPYLCTKKKCVQFHPQVNSEAVDNNGWYIQCNHPKCTERLLKDEAEDKRVSIFKLLSSNLVSFDLAFLFLLIFRRNSVNTILKIFVKNPNQNVFEILINLLFFFVFCYNFSNKISKILLLVVNLIKFHMFFKCPSLSNICVTLGYLF